MKKIKLFLTYQFPAILWMAIIFYFSSLQHFTISENSTLDFIIFKGLHAVEYAFLYFLIFRAYLPINLPDSDKLKYAFILSILYAVSDEVHQTFVPTREGVPRDIIIDSAGILIIYIFPAIPHTLVLYKPYVTEFLQNG